MSNEQLFQDLKQFIEATVHQEVVTVRQEVVSSEKRLSAQIASLRSDMDERFDEVLDAVGEKFNSVDARHQDHERRITRLERKAV